MDFLRLRRKTIESHDSPITTRPKVQSQSSSPRPKGGTVSTTSRPRVRRGTQSTTGQSSVNQTKTSPKPGHMKRPGSQPPKPSVVVTTPKNGNLRRRLTSMLTLNKPKPRKKSIPNTQQEIDLDSIKVVKPTSTTLERDQMKFEEDSEHNFKKGLLNAHQGTRRFLAMSGMDKSRNDNQLSRLNEDWSPEKTANSVSMFGSTDFMKSQQGSSLDTSHNHSLEFQMQRLSFDKNNANEDLATVEPALSSNVEQEDAKKEFKRLGSNELSTYLRI